MPADPMGVGPATDFIRDWNHATLASRPPLPYRSSLPLYMCVVIHVVIRELVTARNRPNGHPRDLESSSKQSKTVSVDETA